MRFLLDEHYSKEIARQLREERGHDVVSAKERDELVGLGDAQLFELMASERRVIVTDNVADFAVLVRQAAGAGREHAGVVFTSPESFPRAKATIGRFVEALDQLLRGEPGKDALVGRVHWLQRAGSHPQPDYTHRLLAA